MKVAIKAALVTIAAAGALAGLMMPPAMPAEPPDEKKRQSGPAADPGDSRAADLSKWRRYAGELGEVYRAAADAASPAVVHIASSRAARGLGGQLFGPFFDVPRTTVALGSGVIVRHDGYIITNYHVVKGAGKLTVKLRDGRQFEATVVGSDPPTDLAVVRVAAADLPVADMGNSDEIAVGHIVLAIGNPYGLERTVTQGIISATGRANVGIADYEDFIQTDAAINPGNSGGPLIDIEGKIIGINTAILTRTGGFQGIGLAIPVNMARKVMNELIERGHVTRGYLGVTIQNVTPELAAALKLKSAKGVVVTDVVKNTPAHEAGLKEGDVITGYEGRAVSDVRHLRSIVATTAVGKEVLITIVRDGEAKALTARIGEQKGKEIIPPSRSEGTAIPRIGIETQDLTESVRRQFDVVAKKGVLIAGVVPDGPADKAGVRPGTVILEINHQAVGNVREFRRALGKIPMDKNVLLLVRDRTMKYYVVVRPKQE